MLDRRIIANVGVQGFGKSFLGRCFVTREPRYIVYGDFKREYPGLPFTDFNAMCDYAAANEKFGIRWDGDPEYFDNIYHLASALRNVMVLSEESDKIPALGWYRHAIFRGRTPDRTHIHNVGQRPQLFCPEFKSQLTELFAWHTTEDAALDWMEVFLGKERTKLLPTLPPKVGFHYFMTDVGPVVERIALPGASLPPGTPVENA